MTTERTLSIVKPDGVEKNLIGEVYRRFEQGGLRVIAAKMLHLNLGQAEGFYAVHRERPFYGDLVRYMTSGPVMVQVLEGTSIALATQAAGIIQDKLQLPAQAFSYLTSHGSLDLEHIELLKKLLNRLDQADDQAAVLHTADCPCELAGTSAPGPCRGPVDFGSRPSSTSGWRAGLSRSRRRARGSGAR